MNRYLLIFWLLVGVSFCQTEDRVYLQPPPDYFHPDNILEFADYLYEDGDYLRAAGEYQRYLFSVPPSAGLDSIYYQMTKAVFLGQDYDRSDRLLASFEQKYPRSTLTDRISLYRAIIRYNQGNFRQSLDLLGDVNPVSDTSQALTAVNYLHLRNLQSAQDICKQSISHNNITSLLCQQISTADSLEYKSRTNAGLYSAIIPGAGKAYCGHTADGIHSLVIVGLTVWQAIDGFHDDGSHSTKGWIFGIIGGSFYLGNIYGSVLAADLYNRHVYDSFLSGVKIDISLP